MTPPPADPGALTPTGGGNQTETTFTSVSSLNSEPGAGETSSAHARGDGRAPGGGQTSPVSTLTGNGDAVKRVWTAWDNERFSYGVSDSHLWYHPSLLIGPKLTMNLSPSSFRSRFVCLLCRMGRYGVTTALVRLCQFGTQSATLCVRKIHIKVNVDGAPQV